MKLKKIVSLALAGVLAVSMLAGCSNNGSNNNSSSSEAPAATGMAGKVIAALDVDNVTFSADPSLQNTLDVLAEKTATTGFTTGVTAANLVTLNSTLGTTDKLTKVSDGGSNATAADAKKETYVFAVNTKGINEEFVAEQLAAKIADESVSNETSDAKMSGLPENSKVDSTGKYQYNFTYTAKVAVVSRMDTADGQTTYVAVVALTRTPTQVNYSEVQG